ncbi:MAG: hypothetical protein H7X76_04205 [Prolixibacteraceae bacterium]|nr:hypothetical protein [Burkholderiales bacterium]
MHTNIQPDMKKLRASELQLKRYHIDIMIRGGISLGLLLLCHYQVIPIWVMVTGNIFLYPLVYLRVHDIGHAVSPSKYGWAARFVPITNPIWGGTRVFAGIHRVHHQYLGTDQDPWLPYYTGHPLRALFFNFIELEYTLVQYVRRHGADRELRINLAFNALCVVLGVVLFNYIYLIHLIAQRVVHTIAIFFFNFYTHRSHFASNATISTWGREQDLKPILPLMRMLWGSDTVDGLIFHNRHHCIGQNHIPVANYKFLTDTGNFTHYNDQWPLNEVVALKTPFAEHRFAQDDMAGDLRD